MVWFSKVFQCLSEIVYVFLPFFKYFFSKISSQIRNLTFSKIKKQICIKHFEITSYFLTNIDSSFLLVSSQHPDLAFSFQQCVNSLRHTLQLDVHKMNVRFKLKVSRKRSSRPMAGRPTFLSLAFGPDFHMEFVVVRGFLLILHKRVYLFNFMQVPIFKIWVGRDRVGKEPCSETQYNGPDVGIGPSTLWLWVQCSNQCRIWDGCFLLKKINIRQNKTKPCITQLRLQSMQVYHTSLVRAVC